MKRYILTVLVSIISVMIFHCLILWILWTLSEDHNTSAVIIADSTMLFIFGILFNAIAYEK